MSTLVTFNAASEPSSVLLCTELLCNKAKELLKNAENQEFTQAVALYTSKSNVYCILIENALSEEKSAEKALLNCLAAAEDTKIKYLICHWQNGGIDLPSFALRKMLCELDPENEESEIILQGEKNYLLRKLKFTMK